MNLITGLSAQPRQVQTLMLDNGGSVTFSLTYRAQQTGWFFNLEYNGQSYNGLRLVNSPNLLRKWIDLLPFGLAVISDDNLEPLNQSDLSDETTKVYLLNQYDVALVEYTLFGGPEPAVEPTSTSGGSTTPILPASWGPASGDLSQTYPNPWVIAAHFGGTRLPFGAISDGQYLKRVGDTIVGGAGGSGSGDVTGPSSAVADDIATFDGTTGKIIKDGGKKVSDLLLKSSNLGDVASVPDSRYNLGFRYVDISEGAHAVVGDGVTNNFSNWFYAAKALEPDGGLTSILVAETGSGYTEGNYSLTISGSGTGSGAAAKIVVATNGRIISATVTASGSGYHVSSRQVGATGIVSGSPTITLNNVDNTGISVGDSVVHPAFPSGTIVTAKPTSMTLTASANATASSAYSYAVFGLPLLSFSGAGAGSGELLKPVVGRLIAYIKPGIYLGCPADFWCLHNTEFRCEGATFVAEGKDSSVLTFGQECARVKVLDATVQNYDELIYNPATRGTGMGFTIQGFDVELVRPHVINIPNFGIRAGEATDGGGPYFGPLKIISPVIHGTCGDGIHLENRCKQVTISDVTATDIGDDIIALYPDDGGGSATQPPMDVTISGVNAINGGWRGIFIGGQSKRVAISGINFRSLSGYGIEIDPGTGTTGPTDVTITSATLGSIGHAGDGFRSYVGNRYPIKINYAQRVTINGVSFSDIEAGTLCVMDNSTDCSVTVWNMLGKTAFSTSGNTNCSTVTA